VADDFNIITEEDKSHLSYGLCVLGQMAAGATLGSLAGGQTLAGAAAGTVWGLFTCRYLAEPIKRKLFSRNERLSDQEFTQTLLAAKRQFPLATRAQLLDLIGSARLDANRYPSRYRG
jgi:flagellar motor component MotA